jgi:hypothetical protein
MAMSIRMHRGVVRRRLVRGYEERGRVVLIHGRVRVGRCGLAEQALIRFMRCGVGSETLAVFKHSGSKTSRRGAAFIKASKPREPAIEQSNILLHPTTKPDRYASRVTIQYTPNINSQPPNANPVSPYF